MGNGRQTLFTRIGWENPILFVRVFIGSDTGVRTEDAVSRWSKSRIYWVSESCTVWISARYIMLCCIITCIRTYLAYTTAHIQLFYQVLNFGMIVSSALMIWKGLMVVTGSESPIVVVLRLASTIDYAGTLNACWTLDAHAQNFRKIRCKTGRIPLKRCQVCSAPGLTNMEGILNIKINIILWVH